MPMSVRAILVSADLMFISKVKEVAAATNATLTVARSVGALEKALNGSGDAGVLILDLEKSGSPLDTLEPLFLATTSRGWTGVSFFSHVHEELEAMAIAKGLGSVMPRSRFVKLLPTLLTEGRVP